MAHAGRNRFEERDDGPHSYLRPRVPPEAIAGLIEGLMMSSAQ